MTTSGKLSNLVMHACFQPIREYFSMMVIVCIWLILWLLLCHSPELYEKLMYFNMSNTGDLYIYIYICRSCVLCQLLKIIFTAVVFLNEVNLFIHYLV